ILGASLVVVLGHDSCGAVGAAAKALSTGEVPTGFVRAVVDRVIPSVVHLPRAQDADADLAADEDAQGGSLVPEPAVLGREHVRHTVRMLQSYSAGLRTAVAEGRCAVVGAEYALAEGRVRIVEAAGAI